MYRNLLKENANIIDADKDKLVKIINKHVTNRSTALDIGCHYGFMTQLLCRHFNTVHAFDFNNDVFECFLKNAQKFLTKGDKVKFTIRFKGRELMHSNLGHDLMNRIQEDIKSVGKVEMNPKFDGKQMIMVIQPL